MARLRTDVVVITFRRVIVNGVRIRIIRSVRIIGSASPCNRFLVVGRRVRRAERCLLTNGFRVALSTDNVLVFIRRRSTCCC